MKSLKIMLSVIMVLAFAAGAMAASVTVYHPGGSTPFANTTLQNMTQDSSGNFVITLLSTSGTSPVCGNGLLETGEQCDPPGANCSSTCQTIGGTSPVCGNGLLETGEQCDPPGANCSATCQTIVSTPEGCKLLPFMGGKSSEVVSIDGHTSDTTGLTKYCFDVPANMSTVAFAIFSGDWGTNQDFIMSRVAQPTWETWRNTIEASVKQFGYALSRKATATYWYGWTPENNESLIIYGLSSSTIQRYYVTVFNTGTTSGRYKYGWNAY